jgi:hypothetical protein
MSGRPVPSTAAAAARHEPRAGWRPRRALAVVLVVSLGLALSPVLDADAVTAAPATVEREVRGFGPAGPADAAGRVTSVPVDVPIAFSLAGFQIPVGAVVEVRAGDQAGRWSAWYEAEPLTADDGPDGWQASAASDGDALVHTEPLWFGEADRLQVRVRGGDPADVRATAIDSAGLSRSRAQRLRDVLRRGAPAAEASDVPPEVISRAAWGADESWMTWTPRTTPTLELAIVHHTAGGNTYTAEQAPAVVRGIYHYHARTLGWGDIGYNVLVDRYGKVYEGRAGGLDRAVIAGHAAGFNARTFGISIMGDFEHVAPPAEAFEAVARMTAWKLAHHGVDPSGTVTYTSGGNSRFPAGTPVTLPVIAGHRDTGWTACPGASFYAQMGELRTRVLALTPPLLPDFVPVPPVRVLDTRDELHGDVSAKVGHRMTVSTQIADRHEIPADAEAVAINITAVRPSRATFLTVYPSGQSRPDVSSVNVSSGAVVNNFVVASLGTNGRVDIYNHNGEVDVVFDVVGFKPRTTGYRPLPPSRVLDTRVGIGDVATRIGRRATVSTTVAGRSGVPTDAAVVAVNITAIAPTRSTYLSVFPSGTPRPLISSVNAAEGRIVSNFVLAALGDNGRLDIYNHDGFVDVVLDVVGYLPRGTEYVPLSPARVLDTRNEIDGDLSDPVGRRQTVSARIAGRGGVPADARAVAVNVTAVTPTHTGFLTVFPSGQPRPNVSALNFSAGAVVGNFIVVELGAGGALDLYNHEGDTDFVIDVVGYYR